MQQSDRYHGCMMSNDPRRNQDDEPDFLDAIPGFDRVSTNLQRAIGPSCLLSLIITALVLVILRRYIKLPLTGLFVMTVIIWWAVLVILVRLGGPLADDDE